MGLRIIHDSQLKQSASDRLTLRRQLANAEALRWSQHFSGDIRELHAKFIAKLNHAHSQHDAVMEQISRQIEVSMKKQIFVDTQITHSVVSDKLLELL